MAARSLTRLSRAASTFRPVTRESVRSFSSSVALQRGGVPSFSPTSSPELDELLATYREKVFLFGSLPDGLQSVITRKKNKQQLENDPIRYEAGGETFQLKFVDVQKDLPNARAGLQRLLDLAKESIDWQQLPGFLEGLHSSGVRIPQWLLTKVARRAGEAGEIGVIVECARRVKTTGFSLNSVDTVAEVMWYIQYEAYRDNWSKEAVAVALKRAEQVTILLEAEGHGGGKPVLQSSDDPRIRPEVIGTMLQLASVQATLHMEGNDAKGLVEKYAQRFTGTKAGESIVSKAIVDPADVHAQNLLLRRAAPVLQGLHLATSILPASSAAAKSLATPITELKAKADAALAGSPEFFGAKVYTALTSPEWKTFAFEEVEP